MTLKKFFQGLGKWNDPPIELLSTGVEIFGSVRGYATDLEWDLNDWILYTKVKSFKPCVMNWYGEKELGFKVILSREHVQPKMRSSQQ